MTEADVSQASALRFVVLIGIVSLFADVTYEGAHSITVPYLAVLGASEAIVGIVAGFGVGRLRPATGLRLHHPGVSPRREAVSLLAEDFLEKAPVHDFVFRYFFGELELLPG
jgi:hypothetical protein